MNTKDLIGLNVKIQMLERFLNPKELKNPAVAEKLKLIRKELLKYLSPLKKEKK
ncbi:MAG: hypothetical protein ACOYL6_17475 [Bacteriovoracaceae bacterium]